MGLDLPRPSVAVFDLDGTLVDSLRDIANALNICQDLLGLPTRPIADYRYLVGEGIPKLCYRLIGASHAHLTDRLAELARACYRAELLVHTRPYAGIQELIERLRAGGVRLAVLSNKPDDMTRRIVRHFWPNGAFDRIVGYTLEDQRKPNPHSLLEIAATLGATPAQTWLIGDTPTDIETAQRAGAAAIGVTWGFRTRADLVEAGALHIVDHPDQIA